MASTLVELFKIAIYESDGENLGDLIGYKSIDGDITEEPDMIQYYASSEVAEQYIDNSDELELGMRETIRAEYIDFQDTLELNIISK